MNDEFSINDDTLEYNDNNNQEDDMERDDDMSDNALTTADVA